MFETLKAKFIISGRPKVNRAGGGNVRLSKASVSTEEDDAAVGSMERSDIDNVDCESWGTSVDNTQPEHSSEVVTGV